ncbi:Acetylcholine-gated chloride channel subunit acc-2 [Caenorhabditis elegans]|uniref:Acetylcholine-gated chloride channel subunit acc-2 n=1 Tax=Caenorhabditis elegans TaxID=6239 RepID=ACC2_CAEEL|nr:Acetylcholine-gated chloride channel subunit acc-2 [Caenorhabditis elegans]Q18812.1 RecName: Full=Acetylcholine-gated chloride channel subunit acc-2; Flags: Precursor [Caenorhabditis elegans]CAA94228.1 Acetylcholine-gated chloride channel subunit acc-2 [Caenorhabditis elegans]|eukprot:NP_501567.1 Acetylcholine-gated chloride channel subunit acc-2 [Caenorhabditis elegans]
MIFTLLSTLPVLIITTELDYSELVHSAELVSSSSYIHHKTNKKPDNCTRDTDIIDRLLNGTGYNKFRIPQEEGMTVVVEIWIQAITSIDELTNDFDMDIYITETWLDPALNFQTMTPCKGNLSLNHQVLDRLWTPNSCFINSKVAQIHNSPFRSVFLMLFPNGTVMVNYRVRVKGPCSLDLSNFPLDLQKCSLIYESFNYNRQEVEMRWSDAEHPVFNLSKIMLPDFDLFEIQTERRQEPYPAGMWDELHVTIIFERRFIWYFMQAYLPTYLTIFISWISFSLGSRAIPARTMLGVNSLLAIVFSFGNIMRNLPRVSYIKGIDVWMLVSMTFIFCSLLELAIVGFMVRDETVAKKKQQKKISGNISREESPHGIISERRFMFPPGCSESSKSLSSCTSGWTPERIDSISSVMFPFSFFVFNIIYWFYYIHRKEIIKQNLINRVDG